MGVYQKYRGNPETKLFFLLENFLGGINTEFSDDNSNDVDFDSIINFEMDKLGTLNKRGGFGEISALSQIFDKIAINRLPRVYNRTDLTPSPETENNNIVYAKLLQNDNGCFRALAGFTGENAYRKYQELYGFQNNHFKLLIITADFVDEGGPSSSHAFYYDVGLPELEEVGGVITDTETITIVDCVAQLPVTFNWDRNLMNIETVEFYDKIHFTSNNKGLVTFNRNDVITNDSSLAAAFSYSGFSEYTSGGPVVSNDAHVPSGLEVRHIGFNVLCDNPMQAINTTGLSNETIQGVFVCTTDNIPLLSLPLGQSFMLNIIYTGNTDNFAIEMKEGDKALTFTKNVNSTYTRTGLKVYDIQFQDVPNGEVEIKITKVDSGDQPISGLEPYYDYYDVAQVDKEAKPVTQLNIGDYGVCEMYNRAVYYKNDTIWFSDINNFNYIPNYNWVSLPIEPTDKITKICYFKKGYIVFTKQKIYKMVGSFGQNDFAIQPVNTSLGCHAGNTVVPIEDTLYFASPRGLYALKSSTFVEGFENVRELDVKVKTLTNSFTKFNEDMAQPSIRFNGINERAYATRYKDKYLLFYNNYGDKGDYASENDLDTLVYQFDVGAFTTYRFKEKPTFLFMVDNAIETFSTVASEPEYDVETPIIEYDFDDMEGTVVEDLSGNDRTGYIRGGYGVVGNKGITLDGSTSSVQTNMKDINFVDGFNIKLDLESTKVSDDDYIYVPLFKFNNYKYTFPDFSQTQTSVSTVRIPNIVTYRMTNDVTYTYKQLNSSIVQITPTITLTLDSRTIRTGTVSYSIRGLETTYVNVDDIVVNFDSEFKTILNPPSFLVSINDKTFIQDLITLELECVTAQGTFSFEDIRDIRDGVSLTNFAYGGTSTDLPYYEFYGHIDGETGQLTTGIWTTSNIDAENVVINNDVTLVGTKTYDFKTTPKQVLDIRFKKIGNYLNCSSYINNELYEDLGYFPIQLIENLVSRAENKIEYATYFEGNINYMETYLKGVTSKYNLTEGEGELAYDSTGNVTLLLSNCEWIIRTGQGLIFDGENTYVEMPTLPPSIPFEQGFSVEFEGTFPLDYSANIFDIATLYDNGKAENKNASITCFIEDGRIGFSTNALNFKSFRNSIPLDYIVSAKHKYKFDCRYIGDKMYTLSVYVDNFDVSVISYTFIGSVSNALRTSNFIGKSNTITDNLLKGSINNFKISVYESDDEVEYRNALYEFDIAPTDFGKDIYIEAITKGINMKYPQHMKKLKHIFVKAIGGNKYGEFFFELYADGHMVNDPRVFYVYKDENGTLVYDYTGERILSLDEINSTLGNIRLDETALGQGKYQTKKLVIPKKAKNFSCRIYGNTDDYISLESLGFVCKLGKVKEG